MLINDEISIFFTIANVNYLVDIKSTKLLILIRRIEITFIVTYIFTVKDKDKEVNCKIINISDITYALSRIESMSILFIYPKNST